MCAQQLGSNEIASTYAEKAVNADNAGHNESPNNRILYCTTLLNLGVQSFAKSDFQKAFNLFSMAIDNYESVHTEETNKISKEGIVRMYAFGAEAAAMIGKTNEFTKFSRVVQALNGISSKQSK